MTVDLIVLGSGEAAQSIVYSCREAGWSVTVVDSDPFGGTCSLRGCDPKKVLVGVAELVDWNRRMTDKGVSSPVPRLVWPEMIRFKHTFVDGGPASNEKSFTEAGIRAIQGRAHFVGPTSLRVEDETLVARHLVIAAGARHAPLGIPGEEYLTTSTQFLDLEQLPRRVVFVGGGYIAFEFAHVAARADADVSILHRGDRPLERFDVDLVAQLVKATRDLGVDLRMRTTVTAIEKRGNDLIVHARDAEAMTEVPADLVVHAAGRVPEIDDMALDVAGVERAEDGGVAVNEYLQSVPVRFRRKPPYAYNAFRWLYGESRDPSTPTRATPSPTPTSCCARKVEAHTVDEVYLMGGPAADVFVDVTDLLERKIEALRATAARSATATVSSRSCAWMGMIAKSGGLPEGRLAEAYRLVPHRVGLRPISVALPPAEAGPGRRHGCDQLLTSERSAVMSLGGTVWPLRCATTRMLPTVVPV